jgi:hypothetical protein
MRSFKSVTTLLGTGYKLGDELLSVGTIVTDITIDYEDDPLVIRIWVSAEGKDESLAIEIPYHAVELVVLPRK